MRGQVIKEVSFTRDSPHDYFGHGTHVAAIIAGLGKVNPKIRGIAPDAKLLNVKVLNNYGEGYLSWIIAGVEWTVENGVDIISMSFGGFGNPRDPLALAVEEATKKGY